jgi:putative protease
MTTTLKKPELLVTAANLAQLRRLIAAGADALVIGEARYGMRLPGSFDLPQIAEAVGLARASSLPVRIYVAVNIIFHNDLLPALPAYLTELAQLGVDGVIFSDPALLLAQKQAGCSLPLHWNPETTATNYMTANYWGTKGAVRMIAARELNLEQLTELKQHLRLELQVQVHGMTCIYHSKRDLLSNYVEHVKRDPDAEPLGKERGLMLRERERPDERFPVYEDENGTHMMSADDICMLEAVHELIAAGIDSLKIDGLLQTDEYVETVVRAYRAEIDAYCADPDNYEFDEDRLEPIACLQPDNRPLSFGFLYKEQVY